MRLYNQPACIQNESNTHIWKIMQTVVCRRISYETQLIRIYNCRQVLPLFFPHFIDISLHNTMHAILSFILFTHGFCWCISRFFGKMKNVFFSFPIYFFLNCLADNCCPYFFSRNPIQNLRMLIFFKDKFQIILVKDFFLPLFSCKNKHFDAYLVILISF